MILFVGVVGMLTFILAASWLYGRMRGPARPEEDVWAERHGLELTAESRPWVAGYLRTGRDLRQIGGFGGLVVAASISAATGLDLHVSGLVWILIGYLVGGLWAELALTRVPSGTQRAASLTPRRLSDYLPRRVRIAQVGLPAMAVAMGWVCVLALRAARLDAARVIAAAEHSGNLVALPPHSTEQLLQSGALAAAVIAPLIMLVVWVAQRYLISRPQPSLDPGLVAADDALRASSVRLLGASGLAAVSLLIASQFGYLASVTAWFWLEVSRVGAALAVLGAILIFRRWRDAAWPVRRGPVEPPGTRSAMDLAPDPRPADTPAPVLAGGQAGGTTATIAPPPPVVSAEALGSPAGSVAWRVRRRPTLLAVALIVLVGLTGWALRTWGALNPAVTVTASMSSAPPQVARWQAVVSVYNEARAPITVDAVTAAEPSSMAGGSFSGPGPAVPSIASVTVAPPSAAPGSTVLGEADRPLPATVAGGTTATLYVDLTAPDCASATSVAPFVLVVHYRSQAGRSGEATSYPTGVQQLGPCVTPLPTGPQPADPVAAEAAVRSVFTAAYDPAGVDRIDLIDDPRGVKEAAAQARAGPYGAEVGTTSATVDEVSFDRPDHAWVRYELTGIGGTRVGELTLIGGTWKVARATVCTDLALAQATCAPEPN